MEWRPYASCCHRQALAVDSAFCGECGRLLLRCMAFQECMSLVTPGGACPMCVAPALSLEKGAITRSQVGRRLAIPLVLRNGSGAGRALRVDAIVVRDGSGEVPVPLPWEEIDAQSERGFTVETAKLEQAGTRALDIVATLASRYKGREERYAFGASVTIEIDTPDPTQIVQNINLTGAQFATGGMVHAPVANRQTADREPVALRERTALAFERAERFEIPLGIRGYRNGNLRVPRSVEFAFPGFPDSERPAKGATIGQRGVLACGRAGRQYDAEHNPLPSDLSLRVHDPRTGEVDERAAVFISRHHFDLLVMNDRLHVVPRGSNGLEVNGQRLAIGSVHELGDGAEIVPIPGHRERLALKIRFRAALGIVETIELAREPAAGP